MAALIKASLEIEHGQTVATAGLIEPAAALGAWQHAVAAIPGPTKLTGRRLVGIACWSHGLACHLILEHGAAVPQTSAATNAQPAQRKSIGQSVGGQRACGQDPANEQSTVAQRAVVQPKPTGAAVAKPAPAPSAHAPAPDSPTATSGPTTLSDQSLTPSEIPHFDATARRREKMRAAGGPGRAPAKPTSVAGDAAQSEGH